jgi:TolB-like protein
MRKFVRGALALASVAMVTPVVARAQAATAGKPVIAVMYFDNNSFGKDRADYDGLGKGIADMLITDMASNPSVRIVERERIQALLTEQNLTKGGAVDPQTAIRLGKIVGAQYMITGGFMSDGKGNLVLTARAINVETSAITNPTRLNSKGDDVLGLIAQLSAKLNGEMKLPALRVGDASSAQPAGEPAAQVAVSSNAKVDSVKSTTVVAESKPAETKPMTVAAKPMQVAQAKPAHKMDMKTALLYSKALEEEDAGNRTKAVELYRQVVQKFPEFAPAQQKIAKLSRG